MKFRRHTSYLTTDYSCTYNDRWSQMVASFIQSNMFFENNTAANIEWMSSVDINDNSTSLATYTMVTINSMCF